MCVFVNTRLCTHTRALKTKPRTSAALGRPYRFLRKFASLPATPRRSSGVCVRSACVCVDLGWRRRVLAVHEQAPVVAQCVSQPVPPPPPPPTHPPTHTRTLMSVSSGPPWSVYCYTRRASDGGISPPAPLLPPLGGKPPSRRKRSSNISRYQEAIRGRRMEMNCVLVFFFRFFILYLDCCVCRGGGAEGMWDPADPLPPPSSCRVSPSLRAPLVSSTSARVADCFSSWRWGERESEVSRATG